MSSDGLPPNRTCPRCGARFRCHFDDPHPCWCARDFPPLPPEPGVAGCLCPRCLAERVRGRGER